MNHLHKKQETQTILNDLLCKANHAKKIVFLSGNFNIIHPGHLRLLQFAAECGDFLVVGVNNSRSPGVRFSEETRLAAVRAINMVNYAFLLQEPVTEFIAQLRPAIVVKGKEYANRYNEEQQIVDAYGGTLSFGSGEVRFSSLDLLEREYFESNFSTIKMPYDYPERHGFKIIELKNAINAFRSLKLLVIGDLIVDEYIECDPLGMSQEDPTIVVTPIDHKRFVGGAGIVAAHAQGLGAQVQFLTISGQDSIADFALNTLQAYGVSCIMVGDQSRPTTLKQRFRASGKTLLRVSQLRQHAIQVEIADQLMNHIKSHVDEIDMIIFADFNYGCLPQTIVDKISTLAKSKGIPLVADSQASSQLSDIARFKDTMLITPTEREARLALQDFSSGLAIIAEELQRVSRATNVAITLGAEGLLVYAKKTQGYILDSLPAFNTAPKDVAGAGDSFLIATSMGLCVGLEMWAAAFLGSLAAACQVSRVGNIPLSYNDLLTEIDLGVTMFHQEQRVSQLNPVALAERRL